MEAKPYPIEKRKILMERSKEDFVAFLQEVTDQEGNKFIREKLEKLQHNDSRFQRRRAPRHVPGFRPGHAPLNRTVPTLVSKLKREQELTNPDSPFWELFKNAWKCWVRSHTELNNILDEFDNSADFDDSDRCIVPPNSELDIQCFHILLKANHNNQIDQETIRRFYQYGHFKKDEQIEELIDKTLPNEEIERRRRLTELPDQVDRLHHEIDEVRTQISDLEPINELQKVLDRRFTTVQQSFESQHRELKQQITALQQSLENQISESNFNQTISLLRQSISALESRITAVEKSLSKTQSATTESINSIVEEIAQLNQQIQNTSQSVEEQLKTMNIVIIEIQSKAEYQNQPSVPRIAHRAMEIGKEFETELATKTERYTNEEEYLKNLSYFLQRFDLTDSETMDESEEIAAAIHIAIKAFSALEIADERIIKILRLICGNHLHTTQINVELGWLGLRDWFPDLFSDECFDEHLERIDLDISIQKMLETGNMPWAIHLNNWDRSFPESYLPSFLNWISELCRDSIRVFLTRCSGTNRCVTSFDIYERVARLPKPHKPKPINVRHLGPQYAVTRSEWVSWCSPPTDVNIHFEKQFEFLDQLQLTIKNMDVQLPKELLPEIQHYLQLSHHILSQTHALDWALTLRFLPWIENQPKIIDSVLSLLEQEYDELQHFYKELQWAREEMNESN